MSTMQAAGKSLLAMILSLSRQGIMFIPTIFILDSAFGFEGLIWAQPIADMITLVVAGVIITGFYKSLSQDLVAIDTDDENEKIDENAELCIE